MYERGIIVMTCNSAARKQYKATARADIRAKFWPTMGAVLLYTLPVILVSMILEIGMRGLSDSATIAEIIRLYQYLGIYVLVMFLLVSPIQFGFKHYAVALARGEACSPAQVFSCFTSGRLYLTSLKLSLCIAIRSLGWIALLYLCMFLTALPMFFIVEQTGVFVVYVIIWAILMILLALLFSVKIRRYDGAYINMIDTPDASVWQAVKACAPIFKGHNWELLVFDWSFILWMLASVVTFGIVGIYLTAYQEVAFVHYFDDLCGKKAGAEQPPMPDVEL